MNIQQIEQLASEAGLFQHPYTNVNKEFLDTLKVFSDLVAKECIVSIENKINEQQKAGIIQHTMGLNQARFAIAEIFGDEILD